MEAVGVEGSTTFLQGNGSQSLKESEGIGGKAASIFNRERNQNMRCYAADNM